MLRGPTRTEKPRAPSAERHAIRLGARLEELDLEPALDDRPGLADQLVGALVGDEPAAIGVNVAPVRAIRELAIQEDPKRDRGAFGRRTRDEVEVAGMELEGE